jgi:hypothetical protein
MGEGRYAGAPSFIDTLLRAFLPKMEIPFRSRIALYISYAYNNKLRRGCFRRPALNEAPQLQFLEAVAVDVSFQKVQTVIKPAKINLKRRSIISW